MSALILNIETATERCSVCLSQDGQLLAIEESDEVYSHAAHITLLIDACMKAAGKTLAQIDAVALSAGPGSYTALRVGASVAKGICYSLDKKMIAIDTLQALALAAYQETQLDGCYFPMIDARRMEVYTAKFDPGGKRTGETEAKIIDESSFLEYRADKQKLILSGNGSIKCKEVLGNDIIIYAPVFCSARHLISLAEKAFQNEDFSDPAYFSPTYFKAPNITKAKDIWRK